MSGPAPEEMFDVVDGLDRVVGRAARSEVHRRGLLHRAVHALVFGSGGRVFLQLRSRKKDTFPGRWDSSSSGHVGAGETYDAAALRELAEEIGLALPEPPPRWFRLEACADTGGEFVWVYRVRHDGPFALDPAEIERGAWFEPAEVTRGIEADPDRFAPAFRLLWREAAARPQAAP